MRCHSERCTTCKKSDTKVKTVVILDHNNIFILLASQSINTIFSTIFNFWNNAMAHFWVTPSISSRWNRSSAMTSSTILALMNTLRWLADSRCACRVFPKATSALAKNTSWSSALSMFWYSSHFSLHGLCRDAIYFPLPEKLKNISHFWFWPFCHQFFCPFQTLCRIGVQH